MRHAFMLCGLLMLWNGLAHACRCNFPTNATEAVARSSATFAGIVEHVTEDQIVVAVYETWKGDVADKVTLLEDLKGSNCTVDFEEGERYLIFARPSFLGKGLATDICAGTGPVERLQKYLKQMGPGKSMHNSGNASEQKRGPTNQ